MDYGEITKSSKTAVITAYNRRDAGIPFADEIWKEIEKSVKLKRAAGEAALNFDHGAARRLLVTRFNAITKLIARSKDRGIFEIAAGFSPRGIIIAKNSSIKYIETDLDEVISEKKRIVSKVLARKGQKRENLEFAGLDVTDSKQWRRLLKNIDGKITIVAEGLMNYLTTEERIAFLTNVRNALSEKGGRMVLAGVRVRGKHYDAANVSRLGKIAGMNLDALAFDTEADFIKLLQDIGFEVEKLGFKGLAKEFKEKIDSKAHKESSDIMLANGTIYILTLSDSQ